MKGRGKVWAESGTTTKCDAHPRTKALLCKEVFFWHFDKASTLMTSKRYHPEEILQISLPSIPVRSINRRLSNVLSLLANAKPYKGWPTAGKSSTWESEASATLNVGQYNKLLRSQNMDGGNNTKHCSSLSSRFQTVATKTIFPRSTGHESVPRWAVGQAAQCYQIGTWPMSDSSLLSLLMCSNLK